MMLKIINLHLAYSYSEKYVLQKYKSSFFFFKNLFSFVAL
ncbi:hypothetical protein L21SP5_01181 [Salinivirga cyanobacteriivorans]|uniref:Uncharacterized protein n=1 Tax=Salinivirga cyanobacteriivorans TaxID=1307839 RepID=A0A0S2HXY3_9BACT|nr:hypothetical protein L21SP5_01181 [Salinivirga cyanobacteriivorans]